LEGFGRDAEGPLCPTNQRIFPPSEKVRTLSRAATETFLALRLVRKKINGKKGLFSGVF